MARYAASKQPDRSQHWRVCRISLPAAGSRRRCADVLDKPCNPIAGRSFSLIVPSPFASTTAAAQCLRPRSHDFGLVTSFSGRSWRSRLQPIVHTRCLCGLILQRGDFEQVGDVLMSTKCRSCTEAPAQGGAQVEAPVSCNTTKPRKCR